MSAHPSPVLPQSTALPTGPCAPSSPERNEIVYPLCGQVDIMSMAFSMKKRLTKTAHPRNETHIFL